VPCSWSPGSWCSIAWPEITVWVLALLIGVRLLIWGVIQQAIAAQMRSLTR